MQGICQWLSIERRTLSEVVDMDTSSYTQMLLPHEVLFEALNFIIKTGITLSLLAGIECK